MNKDWLKKRRALPLIAFAGLIILILVIKLAPGVKRDDSVAKPPVVSFIQLNSYEAMPRAIGYGNAVPAIEFNEMAEVSGRVIEVNPQLQKGELVRAGTEMLRIDDVDYILALERARADQASATASLAELEQTEINLNSSKSIIEKKLSITAQELKRYEKLRKNNSVSQSALDNTRNNYLKQQQELTETNNALALLTSQRLTTQAKIRSAESAVATAERNLQHTRLVLPYDARISDVSIEKNQLVSAGSHLFSAHAISKFEIEVQLPFDRFVQFVPTSIERHEADSVTMQKMIQQLQLQARISLVGSLDTAVWSGTVERISETLNPTSRTLGVIVTVDNPYLKAKPGTRPPLLDGMYMQVELLGKPAPYLLLPRRALHQGELYSLDGEDRLQRVAIENYQTAGDVVMLKSEQLQGSRIITSELFPAVEGMKLTPVADEQAAEELAAFARGEGSIL